MYSLQRTKFKIRIKNHDDSKRVNLLCFFRIIIVYRRTLKLSNVMQNPELKLIKRFWHGSSHTLSQIQNSKATQISGTCLRRELCEKIPTFRSYLFWGDDLMRTWINIAKTLALCAFCNLYENEILSTIINGPSFFSRDISFTFAHVTLGTENYSTLFCLNWFRP